MRNKWFFLQDLEGTSLHGSPMDSLIPDAFGPQILSFVAAFVEKTTQDAVPSSLALQDAFNGFAKLAGALLVWCSGSSHSNMRGKILPNSASQTGKHTSFRQVKNITSCRQNLVGYNLSRRPEKATRRASSFSIKNHFRISGKLQSLHVLSLAAAVVPPFDNLCTDLYVIPYCDGEYDMHGSFKQRFREAEHRGCPEILVPELKIAGSVVEPRTGIEFPTTLDSIASGENRSNSPSEVLVGTGYKTMTIIKIKPLRVYAFGIYVHLSSMCEKLGPKYASVPASDLKNCENFYQDLLRYTQFITHRYYSGVNCRREDVAMTIRLVVNCHGMKINSVRDAFESSLRARLEKANPETDYKCLNTFGSCFTQDIALPVGTIIDIRRTADGQLITEIGGNQAGSVHSRDLCRAFFDMYIGDFPVSEQTKEEIGERVGNIISKCR